MFLGEFSHTLDSKGRLTIPAKFRDLLMPGLVVTRSPSDRCLLVMPMSEWQVLSDKMKSLSLVDSRSALLRRALFSAAEDLKPDKQGRILLSQRLRDYAGIDSDVLVAGMDSYIELWEPGAWDRQVTQVLESGEMDNDIFAALGI